jgi:hypothetical protein
LIADQTAAKHNEPDQRPQEAAITACALHLRAYGPLLADWHVFDQLIELDIAFPGLTFRDFLLASVVAGTEGQG